MRSRLAVPWIALFFWWVLAAAFGMYPTYSLKFLWGYGTRIHALPFLFAGIAKTPRSVRVIMTFFAVGYMLVLLYCYKFGTIESQRFFVPDTSLGNSNDLALHLLFGACFMLILMRGTLLSYLLFIPAMAVLAYYVLKTASRGAMITLLVVLTILIFLIPRKYWLTFFVATAFSLLAIIPLLPAGTMKRLFTFTNVTTDVQNEQQNVEQHAVYSTRARTQLQKRAITLTLQNPLLGVGTTMFPNAVDELVQSTERRKSSWQVSHNTYLEVSSESGIPGLIFYLWTLGLCLKLNFTIYRSALKASLRDISRQSFCILSATIVYAVGVLFSSIAYDYHLAVLVGFTAANHRAWQALGFGAVNEPTLRHSPPAPASAGSLLHRQPRARDKYEMGSRTAPPGTNNG
jgi:hypothetical protein